MKNITNIIVYAIVGGILFPVILLVLSMLQMYYSDNDDFIHYAIAFFPLEVLAGAILGFFYAKKYRR